MNERVLIVDDEEAIRLSLKIAFERAGMRPFDAAGGRDALALLESGSFDLLILDVMMRDMDGYEVLSKLRETGNHIPVIMLSGKSDEVDQVTGLDLGADSYITKPFHAGVLIETAKALLRRRRVYNHDETSKLLHIGPFTRDYPDLTYRKDGRPLDFTLTEQKLFSILVENAGRDFTKEELYHRVWNDNMEDDNTITVYIRRLRSKIEDDPKNPRYLKTIWGVGYRFEV